MIKNIIKYIITFVLSIGFMYMVSNNILLPYFLYVDEVKVPDIIGENASTAKKVLEKQGLSVNLDEIQYLPSKKNDKIGIITNINPPENQLVKKGTKITLQVLGERGDYNVMPNLIFKSKDISLNMLKGLGVKIDTMVYDYWNTICDSPIDYTHFLKQDCNKSSENEIWNQIPMPGEKVFNDEGVTLFISKGNESPSLYTIPLVEEKTLLQAINIINKSGLLLGVVEYQICDSSMNCKMEIINNLSEVLGDTVLFQEPPHYHTAVTIQEKINLEIKR